MYYKTKYLFVSLDEEICNMLMVKISFACLMCASCGMSGHRVWEGPLPLLVLYNGRSGLSG
jgi:hypothetical protein